MPYSYGSSGWRRPARKRYGLSETQMRNLISLHRDRQAAEYVPIAQQAYADVAKEQQTMQRAAEAGRSTTEWSGGGREPSDDTSPAWYERVGAVPVKALELLNRPFEFMGAAGAAEVESAPEWVKRVINARSAFGLNKEGARLLAHIPAGLIGTAKVLLPGVSDLERKMGIKEDQSYREQLGKVIEYQTDRPSRYWGEKFITESLASAPLMLLGTGLSPLKGLSAAAKAARAGNVAKGVEAAERAYIATETLPFRLVGKGVRAGGRVTGAAARKTSAAVHHPIERLDTWLTKERKGLRGAAMAPVRGVLGPLSKGLANESDRSMVRNVPSRVNDVLTHMTRRATMRTGAESGQTVSDALGDVLTILHKASEPAVRGQAGQRRIAQQRLNLFRKSIGEADDIGRVGTAKEYGTLDALQKYTKENKSVRNAVKWAADKAYDGNQDGAYLDVAFALQKAIAAEKKIKIFDPPKGINGWGNKLYNGWRMAVLSTPWYVMQNGVENNLRLFERFGPRGLQGIKRTNHDYFLNLQPPEAIKRAAARGILSYVTRGKKGLRKEFVREREEADTARVAGELFSKGWQDSPLGMLVRAGGAFDGNAYERGYVIAYGKELSAIRNSSERMTELLGERGYTALKAYDDQMESTLQQIGTYASPEDMTRIRSMVDDARLTPAGAQELMGNINKVMNDRVRDVLDPALGQKSIIPLQFLKRGTLEVRYGWKDAQTTDVDKVAKKLTSAFDGMKKEIRADRAQGAINQYQFIQKAANTLSLRLGANKAGLDPAVADSLRESAGRIFKEVEVAIGLEDIDVEKLFKENNLDSLTHLFSNHLAHDRTAMAQVRMNMVMELEDRAKNGMSTGDFNTLQARLNEAITKLEHAALLEKHRYLNPIVGETRGKLRGVAGTDKEASLVKDFLEREGNEHISDAFHKGQYGDGGETVNNLWRTYFRMSAKTYRELPANAEAEIAELFGRRGALPKTPSPHIDDYFNAVDKEIDNWRQAIIAKFHEIKPGTSKLQDKNYADTISAQMEGVGRLLKNGSAQYERIHAETTRRSERTIFNMFGNPSTRMNIDELMGNLGAPFFFFPSRSMGYYAQAAVRRPALLPTIKRYQNETSEEDDPAYLAGSFKLPFSVAGADLYVNPLKSYMGWQMFGQADFLPRNTPMYEQILRTSQNVLGIGFGPIHTILPRLFERMVEDEDYEGIDLVSNDPQFLIPQQQWVKSLERADFGIISSMANLLEVPTDLYMKNVFGNEIPNWLERRVEKQLVQRGHNPAEATDEQMDGALRDVWWQTFWGIPMGSTVRAVSPLGGDRTASLINNFSSRGENYLEMTREGKNPFAGLRRDDIESMFQDMDKEEMYRYIRPATLTPEATPHWDAHVKLQLALQGVRNDLTTTMDALNSEWSSDPTMSGFQWDKLRKKAYAEYGTQIETIYKGNPLAPRTELTEELAQRGGITWDAYRKSLGRQERVVHKHDQLYDSFVQQVLARDFDDATGEFDYNAYEAAYEEVFSTSNMAAIGLIDEEEQASAKAYVLARRFQNLTAPEKERKRLVELARPYWQVPDDIMTSFGATEAQREAYRQWKAAPSEYKDSIPLGVGLSNSFFKQIDSVSSRAKAQLREENRTIDAYLVRYKNYKARHPANKVSGMEELIQNMNMNIEELIPGLQLYTAAT